MRHEMRHVNRKVPIRIDFETASCVATRSTCDLMRYLLVADIGGSSMATYLTIWNPKRWEWDETKLEKEIEGVRAGSGTLSRWSFGRINSARIGDRVFLMKLGPALPRGIVASGRVRTPPKLGPHYSDPS